MTRRRTLADVLEARADTLAAKVTALTADLATCERVIVRLLAELDTRPDVAGQPVVAEAEAVLRGAGARR